MNSIRGSNFSFVSYQDSCFLQLLAAFVHVKLLVEQVITFGSVDVPVSISVRHKTETQRKVEWGQIGVGVEDVRRIDSKVT